MLHYSYAALDLKLQMMDLPFIPILSRREAVLNLVGQFKRTLKRANDIQIDENLFWIAILLSVVYWVVESLMHNLIFHRNTFLKHFFSHDPHEIWMRFVVVSIFLVFGMYAQSIIARRKRAEEATSAAYAELHQIFNTAADGMRVIDREFNVLRINQTLAELSGVDMEEARDKKCYEVFRGSFCHSENCPLTRILAGEERVEYDVIKERKDGATVPCIVTATPFRSIKGELVGIVEDFRDITERKQAEEALRESEIKYSSLIEQARDGVFMLKDGAFRFVNAAMAKMFGYSVGELRYKPFVELITPECKGEMLGLYGQLTRGKSIPRIYESKGVQKNGTIIDIEVSADLIEYHAGPVVMGIVREVTERKKMEEELLKVQKLDSVGILAGGIAHDFNNLLTGILGNIGLAKLDRELNTLTLESLEKAENATLRAKHLTGQLLTFSRGGLPIKRIIFIPGTLRDAADFAVRGSNVRCEYEIADDLWAIDADEGQIGQVINNLVLNAQQSMPEGGVIQIKAQNCTVEGKTAPKTEGKYVKISIEDRGTGIPKDHLQKVFDPYFTTKHEGRGLGLAVTYSIIRKHSGYIEVVSELKAGTTFHVYLPAVERRPEEKAKTMIEMLHPGHGRILLMDDEDLVLNVGKEILEYLGYEVDCARNSGEALKGYENARAAGSPFDAVILDLTIPGGAGGREVIRKLQKLDPKVKGIVSSGYSIDPIMSDYRHYGFCGVITKPYKIEELSETLSRVVKGEETGMTEAGNEA